MMRSPKPDKWTPLGDRARDARAVETACVALLSALVKTAEEVEAARARFELGGTGNAHAAKRMIVDVRDLIGSQDRGVLYNARLTLGTAGKSIGQIPTYHQEGSVQYDAHALMSELARLIDEGERVRKELWKVHMKSGRDEIGAALADIHV